MDVLRAFFIFPFSNHIKKQQSFAVNGARLEQTTNRMVDLVPISIEWLLHYGMVFLHDSIE